MKRVMVCVFLFNRLLINSMQVKSVASDAVSTVTFEFDGMMALFMGGNQKVSVGIIDAHHHTPEFTVYKLIAKRDGRSVLISSSLVLFDSCIDKVNPYS